MRTHAFAILISPTLVGCLDLDGLNFGSGSGTSGGSSSTGPSGGSGGTGGSQPYTYFDVVMDDRPTAYYRLDEPSGTADVFDSSGLDNHAIVGTEGGTTERDQAGIIEGNTATTLSNGAYILLSPNTLDVAVDQPYTAEAWVFVHYVDGPSAFLTLSTNTADFNTFFWDTSVFHKRHDNLGGYEEIQQEPTYLRDSLHHIVVTFDGEAGQLYIDRNRAYDVPEPLTLNLPDLVDPVRIASVCPLCSVTYDEIAYYPAALSRQRVEAHYDCATEGICIPIGMP